MMPHSHGSSLLFVITLVIAIIISLIYSMSSNSAYASACDRSHPERAFNYADLVFSAQVISTGHIPNEPDITKVELKVLEIFKGSSNATIDFSVTPCGFSSCEDPSPRFEDGKSYIIYAKHQERVGIIPLCNSPEPFTGVRIHEVRVLSNFHGKIPPPQRQIANGIFLKDVICSSDLQLIFKSTDNSPICVKYQTAQKLVERGWGTIISHVREQQF